MKLLETKFQCDKNGTSVILKLRNTTENKFVKIGQTQSFEIRMNHQLTIYKNQWTPQQLKILHKAASRRDKVDSLIILYDNGICNIYILKENYTRFSHKMKKSMPKKKQKFMDNYKRQTEIFDKRVVDYLFQKYDFQKLKVVVVAGPGSAQSRLAAKIRTKAQSAKQLLQKNINKKILNFVVSSTFKQSIEEIMSNKAF